MKLFGHYCDKCKIKWNGVEKIEVVDFPFDSTVFHKGEMKLSYVHGICPKCGSDEDVINLVTQVPAMLKIHGLTIRTKHRRGSGTGSYIWVESHAFLYRLPKE